MSFIPPTTIAVMLSANVVRLFTRRLPAHEQVLHGLTYHAAIPSSDLPALLEPSPEGYVISEASRKKTIQELLSQGRFKRRFEYSTVQGALPAGLRQPWEEIEEHFGGRELGIVTQVLAFSVIAHISVSTIECFQGNPPGISTIPVFFALVAAICISLVRRLVAATVVSKGSSDPKTGTNAAAQRSETYYAFIFALAFSIVTASFLSYFLFIAEGTQHLGGYLPSLSGNGGSVDSKTTVRAAQQSSQELPWLDLGASLRLGVGHFASRMETASLLMFNWDVKDTSSIEAETSYDSLPSTFALTAFIAVISPVMGGLSALLFSPSRRVGRLAHEMSTDAAFKSAGQGQETITGVSTYLMYRLWTFLQFYSPLVVSLLWIRPMVGYVFVSSLLVRCSPESVSRECFPVDFVPSPPPQSEDSFIITGALFTAPSLTDSQWLQVRMTALLIVCAFQIYNIRNLVQASLKKSESDQVDHVSSAAIESPVEKVTLAALASAASGNSKKPAAASAKTSAALPTKAGPLPSGYSSSQLAEITETLFMDQLKAVLSAASVAVLTLSVPALLAGLSLLSLRTGGFVGGVGVCSSSKTLLSYVIEAVYSALNFTGKVPSLIPDPGSFPPRRSALELLLEAANGAETSRTSPVVELGTSASETGRHLVLIIRTIADAFGPSFWRPVMSFSLWWLLVTSSLMQEFGFLLARYLIV